MTTKPTALDACRQPHAVRGAISEVLRKKLGLNVVLAHDDSGGWMYRVV